METRQNDRLIYLKDLLFVVLYRYKQILCAMVIVALLLGIGNMVKGMAIVSDDAANTAAAEQYQAAIADYEERKMQLQHMLAKKDAELQAHNEYMAQSIYMNLNPYTHYEARMKIGVNAAEGETDRAAYLLSAYQMLLTSQQTQEALAQAVNVDVREIGYLQNVAKTIGAETFVVAVKFDTQEGAQTLLDVMEAQLTAARHQLTEQVGSHTLLLMEKTASLRADMTIAEDRAAATERQTALQDEYNALVLEQASLQAPVLQLNTVSTVLKRSALLAVFGAIAVVALIAVWAWVVHVFDTRVYSVRILQNQTGVKVLGGIAGKKRNVIVQLLCKLEDRDTMEPEARAQVLATDVRNRCGSAEMLLVTGDADPQSRATIVEALREAMPSVQVEDNGSLLRDVSAVDALAKSNAVVLVEQCGKSHYNHINEELDVIADYEKTFIGCILLGG